MPTPTSPESRLHARAFKKGATWGTAIAVGALDEVPVISPGNTDLQTPVRDIDPALESDTPYVMTSELLQSQPVDFAVPYRFRYESGRFATMLAMLFGVAGVPTQQGATTAYLHEFTWKDEISGLFGTWVEERPSKIFEVPSAKPFRAEFNFQNGVLVCTISLRGDDCKDDSTTNTATQVDAVTLPSTFYDDGVTAIFRNAVVKINAETGGDVASETALILDDFSVVYERPLEAGVHTAGTEYILEPLEEGLSGPQTQVTLSFPRMSSVNDAFFQTFEAGTTQKMLIEFTGANIESTYDYRLSLFFPRLKMQSPTYPVEEIVKSGLVLQAEEAGAAPTGMTEVRPYIELVNELTTDYLA